MCRTLLLLLTLGAACDDKAAPGESSGTPESGRESDAPDSVPDVSSGPRLRPLRVMVTLDGAPAEGATVVQGGNPTRWTTDSAGAADIELDTLVTGVPTVMASHPDARIDGLELPDDPADLDAWLLANTSLSIPLTSFARTDNLAYVFQDPGDPEHRETSEQCAHCHIDINSDWYGSAHRGSASNPVVHDLYAGAATAFADEETCGSMGGQWWEGLLPGTGASGERCYVGEGLLPALNPDCGVDGPCDGLAEETGGCADCHAPGIDGALGGRDLLEATGFAYNYGVHCDVCHKIEAVDMDGEPGVAGRLTLLRPTEPSPSPVLGDFLPLTFGPYPDVINPRMGSVQREHFHESELCGGCHQLDYGARVPGTALDPARWPDGLLPIQSTYQEWSEGPYGAGASCQSCHMPPDPDTGNSADLGVHIEEPNPDLATGWYRQPGAVRRHLWTGPRTENTPMLRLAASLSLSEAVEISEAGDEELVVQATVTNVGAGHGLPTGEPMRAVFLLVEATCDGEPQAVVGGDALQDVGGWLDRKVRGDDWSVWPGAEPGDVIRVVTRTGDWHDYDGFGPFGDGSFTALDKGLPVEEAVGEAVVVAVDGDVVTLDRALPDGDVAYRGEGGGLPEDGDPVTARAGAAGFAFARVVADQAGSRGAPSFLATDIVSDNRLLPQRSWTSEHRFSASCVDARVTARLYYRARPLDLSRERGWTSTDVLMVEQEL